MPGEKQPSFDDFAYDNLPEGFSSDETMFGNTANFISSLNLDEEVVPYIDEVAEIRGFDSVMKMNLSNRMVEMVNDVKKDELILSNGNEQRRGHYIPVGAHYTDHKLGLLMLHQEVDLGKKELGENFYITRHVLKESVGGEHFSSITFMKFSLKDLHEDGVSLTTLDAAQKKFPYFKDTKGNYSFTPDFSRVNRMKFTGSKEIQQKVKEYTNSKKPDPQLLVDIYSLIKKAKAD